MEAAHEEEKDAESTRFEGEDKNKKFKQFDVIATTDINYHDLIKSHTYYASSTCHQPLKFASASSAFIMKEWKILEEDLPDTIFVRAYEDRIDLLTAVFIGPTGTPYHKGLFFYDIQIPSGYPVLVPKVFRRTWGFKLNPTLNPGEGICFREIKPAYTRILKLLRSIQAYVICSQPKLGHDVDQPNYVLPTFWGYWLEKECLTFNQDVFMLNCQTMLTILRKPPKYFQEFVIHHFHDSAESILFACKLYIDRIPSKAAEDKYCKRIATEEGELEGYKKSMKNIYVDLIKAFMKNGSKYSLENHIKVNVADINIEDTAVAIDIDDIADQNKEIKKKNDKWGLSIKEWALIKTNNLIKRIVQGPKQRN